MWVPNRKNPYLCILEIVSPQGPNLILTTYIPYCKADVLIFYSFDIKTYNKPNGKSFYYITIASILSTFSRSMNHDSHHLIELSWLNSQKYELMKMLAYILMKKLFNQCSSIKVMTCQITVKKTLTNCWNSCNNFS